MKTETEGMGMKLIHCADIHLDSPMQTHMTARQAATRSAEVLRFFVRMTQYARENGVRAVIIAGDLFDGDRVRERTVDAVLDAMQRTPEVDYLYLPGNHDEAAGAFCDRELPVNLKLLGDSWKTYHYENTAVSGVVLGVGGEDIYENVPHVDGCVNVVTLHGQAGTSCGKDQINLKLCRTGALTILRWGICIRIACKSSMKRAFLLQRVPRGARI